jgi:hypothetical protein
MKNLKTFEYITSYVKFYEQAFDKVYEPDMNRNELVQRMILYLKENKIGTKLATSFLMYDIDTWLEYKKKM